MASHKAMLTSSRRSFRSLVVATSVNLVSPKPPLSAVNDGEGEGGEEEEGKGE